MTTVEQDIAYATKIFKDHEIRRRTEDKALLQRSNDGAYWTEIVRGERGTLIIHGDGPDLMFRNWHTAPLETLAAWVAEGGFPYLSTKVACGTGLIYDGDLAKVHLREHLLEEPDSEAKELLGLDLWGGHQEHEMIAELSDIFPDSWEWKLGYRPSWNLIAAQAACKKLIELWKCDALPEV